MMIILIHRSEVQVGVSQTQNPLTGSSVDSQGSFWNHCFLRITGSVLKAGKYLYCVDAHGIMSVRCLTDFPSPCKHFGKQGTKVMLSRPDFRGWMGAIFERRTLTLHGIQGVHLLQGGVADKPDGLAVSFTVEQVQSALVQEHVLCLRGKRTEQEALGMHCGTEKITSIKTQRARPINNHLCMRGCMQARGRGACSSITQLFEGLKQRYFCLRCVRCYH